MLLFLARVLAFFRGPRDHVGAYQTALVGWQILNALEFVCDDNSVHFAIIADPR